MDRLRLLALALVLTIGTTGAGFAATKSDAEAPAVSGMNPESDGTAEPDAADTISSEDGRDAGTEGAGADEAKGDQPAPQAAQPGTPFGIALAARLDAIPDTGSDVERRERAALLAFYGARGYAPLWVDGNGFNADAHGIAQAFRTAWEWGLDAGDFRVPKLGSGDAPGDRPGDLSPDAEAAAEADLSQAILKYARFARGGRILEPAKDLNSNLDRKPKLIDPATVLEGIAAASDKSAYLVGTHPQHAQFQRLKAAYVAALGEGARTGKPQPNAAAKKIRANMEMWRWMYEDMGDFYLMANVPSYMIDVVKNGEVIHSERVVVGETGKQTSIFSRPLKNIVFRPMWRVPESIKVNELWPSLLRGGGLMRQYGLEVETKQGRRLDYRTMDWRSLDIRDYEVVQPPGRKSVMGVVKFSFPSQHTIFMHDTPDKWMFNSQQRTLSHGCLRLRNPLSVAALVLEHDKGWDAAKVAELAKSGPFNNEMVMDKKIRMDIVYFTAWVDDAGALKTYRDIYGHEKRVTQALDGNWAQIAKGRDHLAPIAPDKAHLEQQPQRQQAQGMPSANDDFLGSFFGSF